MIETGGPAFPHVADLVQHSPNGGITTKQITSGGMTLRDYFAAKAIGPVMAQPFFIMQACQKGAGEYASDIADEAYEIADAMLKARNAG